MERPIDDRLALSAGRRLRRLLVVGLLATAGGIALALGVALSAGGTRDTMEVLEFHTPSLHLVGLRLRWLHLPGLRLTDDRVIALYQTVLDHYVDNTPLASQAVVPVIIWSEDEVMHPTSLGPRFVLVGSESELKHSAMAHLVHVTLHPYRATMRTIEIHVYYGPEWGTPYDQAYVCVPTWGNWVCQVGVDG